MRAATLGKTGITVRMEGHVQILGVTHPSNPPSFFWLFGLVWEKPAGKKQEVASLLQPMWISSLLAPKSGLAQKRLYVEAGRGVIYSPPLPWKYLGFTGFGGQDRAMISLPQVTGTER